MNRLTVLSMTDQKAMDEADAAETGLPGTIALASPGTKVRSIRFESAAEALYVKLAFNGIPPQYRKWLDGYVGFEWCKVELWGRCGQLQ